MTDSDELGDSIDIEIRPASSVAVRCIILSAIVRRMFIDQSMMADDAGDTVTLAFDLREWIRAEGLWNDLTETETAHLQNDRERPLPETVEEAVFTSEAFGTLGWAIGLSETLSDGESGDLASLLVLVPSPWDKTSPWASRQSLRPDDQIIRMREQTEIWEWRLEIEPERRKLQGSQLRELNETLVAVGRDGHSAGYLSRADDNAFSIDGVPVSTMRPEDIEAFQSITRSRLRALNWVCGFGDDWDRVPLHV